MILGRIDDSTINTSIIGQFCKPTNWFESWIFSKNLHTYFFLPQIGFTLDLGFIKTKASIWSRIVTMILLCTNITVHFMSFLNGDHWRKIWIWRKNCFKSHWWKLMCDIFLGFDENTFRMKRDFRDLVWFDRNNWKNIWKKGEYDYNFFYELFQTFLFDLYDLYCKRNHFVPWNCYFV